MNSKQKLKAILEGKLDRFAIIPPKTETWLSENSLLFRNKATGESLSYPELEERLKQPEHRFTKPVIIRMVTTGVPVFNSEAEAAEWMSFKPKYDVTMKID